MGTDEGLIYLCTTEFASSHLQCYAAHNTPVYNIEWNSFMPSVFISSAAEWTIKIWDMDYRSASHPPTIITTISLSLSSKPLYTYDLGAPVGDVAWAPYSSTTFAAVTTDGKIHVYDMVWDRYRPICTQSIVHRRKAKLNQIAFNPSHPIIIGK